MTKSRRETDNARDTQYSIGHVPERMYSTPKEFSTRLIFHLLLIIEIAQQAKNYVCMHLFIKLHITAQSGPVMSNTLCYVCMYVCINVLSNFDSLTRV